MPSCCWCLMLPTSRLFTDFHWHLESVWCRKVLYLLLSTSLQICRHTWFPKTLYQLNFIQEEIKRRLNSGNAYYPLMFLNSLWLISSGSMCDYRQSSDWWMDLLTIYIHDWELQTITAPPLISIIRKSPKHPVSLFLACCIFPAVPW
jgi:hypothetical protein